MEKKLFELLNIHKGITAIIGGGGKTTLMLTLAKELAEFSTVIITTSTKILKPEDCETLLNTSKEEIQTSLEKSKMLCVAAVHDTGKLMAPNMSFEELSRLADYVLVEADGSRQLPLKAHASFEPVIPEESKHIIYVIGIDGLGKQVEEACHRPELFAELAECEVNATVTCELAAKVIKREALADCYYINKVSSARDWQNAKELAHLLNKHVYAGDLWKGEYKCLF